MESATFTRQNKVYPKDENGHTSCTRFYIESVDTFTITMHPENNAFITVEKNGAKKAVSIEDCGGEYVYKLQKTKIKARDGAAGLFKFVTDALPLNLFSCHAWRILDYIADEMRPARLPAGI